MKKANTLLFLTIASMALAGCGKSSQDSTSKEEYPVSAAQWESAFSRTLLDNVTVETTIDYVDNSTAGITVKNITNEKDMMSDDKLFVSQSLESVITLDTEKVVGMDADDIAYYVASMEEYGYVATKEGAVYSLNAVSETGGYCRANDDISHYEYVSYDSESHPFQQITCLYSLDYMIRNNIYTFADFDVPYERVGYDRESDAFNVDSEYLADAYSKLLKTDITSAEESVKFYDDYKISNLNVAYASSSQSMSYAMKFSDYDKTNVILPGNPYVCDHVGKATYQDYDKTYHFDVCYECESVMNIEEHTFDDEGSCQICGAQPATNYTLDFSDGTTSYDTHVILSVSDVTGNAIGISLSGFGSDTEYDEDGNEITTFTCGTCDLKIVLHFSETKDENCLVTQVSVYSFYGKGNKKLMDDITIVFRYYDHDYEQNDEYIGNCKWSRTYTCPDCGDTYTMEYYEHVFETTSYDSDMYSGSVECLECGKEYDAYYMTNSDYDDREHEFYIIFEEDGDYYAQYYYETHTDDGDGNCFWCGCPITVVPYEASKCSEATYDYHIYLEINDDGYTLNDYYFDDFEEEEYEDESFVRSGAFTCDECNMRVEYSTTSVGVCTVTYTTVYKIYKNGELLNTYAYVQTVGPDHTWGDPVITTDGCLITETYTCIHCGETSEIQYYDHDIVTTCTVDSDGTHHVHEECSKCGGAVSDYTVSGHDYQRIGKFDPDDHCLEKQSVKCVYCDDTAASSFTDFFIHDDEETVLVDDETVCGDLYVTYCSRCHDFMSLHFTDEIIGYTRKVDGNTITETYGSYEIAVVYTTETVSYMGNDCVQETITNVRITDDEDGVLYENTYLVGLSINHTDECKSHEKEYVGTYGYSAVYRYSCGYVSFGD